MAAIAALMMGLLLPGLSNARAQASSAVCRSNIRQLAVANQLYAQDARGTYVPGASFMRKNLHRWHGQRAAQNLPFDSSRAPLATYLGGDGGIRACPTLATEKIGFEAGCGGYGYNKEYVGSRVMRTAHGQSVMIDDRAGAWSDRIAQPGETIMFADAAFAEEAPIEYSFAEPRFHLQPSTRADPSIHFRHLHLANVVWCDGHVSPERSTFTWSSGLYSTDPRRYEIGWFGLADDNSLFDLE